jgi:2-keto-4-pentenoate hydratase/2-oxohepta-3-ene-1,7-dioic acid hydratase in catechol pathway
MKLASFQWGGRRHVGVLSADGRELTPLAFDAARGALALVEHLSAGGAMPTGSGPRLALAAVQLEAPLPLPRRNLFCVGRNYRAHAKELAGSVFKGSSTQDDGWPIVFTKPPECVIAPGANVELPRAGSSLVSEQIDYEAELAVVIGRGGKNISRARAMDHVFGYTIVNDVTARDVQMRHSQWDLGKSFDTFCPMGPFLVTPDDCDGTRTRVRLWLNGELRQDARTTDLIFDIATLIETCSRGITLLSGDVIATGTPAGVGMGMTPPTWLQSGDVMRIEIDGIGVLENSVF